MLTIDWGELGQAAWASMSIFLLENKYICVPNAFMLPNIPLVDNTMVDLIHYFSNSDLHVVMLLSI